MFLRHRLLFFLLVALVGALAATWFVPRWFSRLTVSAAGSVVRFKDVTQSNASTDVPIDELSFVDLNGQEVKVGDYHGKKHVVLVMTRGYTGQICMFCSTQTSRLLANYADFARRDAEVVVVFPVSDAGEKERVNDLLASAKRELDHPLERVPFPLVLDMRLVAVDRLGIRQQLAKPATYIIDKSGKVRFAYVGTSISDRPSLQSMFDQLDAIGSSGGAPATAAD
jgi:peroxiredoxin